MRGVLARTRVCNEVGVDKKLFKMGYLYSGVRYSDLLYLPTQIRFSIGGERVTCHGSKLTDFLGQTKLTNSRAKQHLELSFARVQVVHLGTAANLWASRRQTNNFFRSLVYFWVGRNDKTSTLEGLGEQNLLFPWGQSLSAYSLSLHVGGLHILIICVLVIIKRWLFFSRVFHLIPNCSHLVHTLVMTCMVGWSPCLRI